MLYSYRLRYYCYKRLVRLRGVFVVSSVSREICRFLLSPPYSSIIAAICSRRRLLNGSAQLRWLLHPSNAQPEHT